LLEPIRTAHVLPIDWRTAHFDVVRVESPGDLPAADPATIDIALLDMNHGYPNVGHDAMLAFLHDLATEHQDALDERGRSVRVLSYAIRDRLMIPDHAGGRHKLYLGTGGPGHLDPRQNTVDDGAREIREDPSWEAPLWGLFDAVLADETAALYGVCHTFGLLCRWSGIAAPVLRGAEKGGPMSGVGADLLTERGRNHPWFEPLVEELPGKVLPVLESRYYDLIPSAQTFPPGMTPIAFENAGEGGRGAALTMVEFARTRDGSTPRVFAVNSHPEIGTPERVQGLLERLLLRGQINAEIFRQRSGLLPVLRDDRRDQRLQVARFVFGDLIERKLESLVRAA
jgi:hypothetical protein